MRDVLPAIGAVAAVIALVLGGLALAGFAPGEVAAVWWRGAAGSWGHVAETLRVTAPLLLCGLAAAVAFRCGALNIGVEGQYLVGAVTLVALTTRFAPPGPAWLGLTMALALGAAAGAAWAGIAALLDRGRGVPVVLSTILLNLVAVELVGLLIEGPLRDPATSAPQSAFLADGFHLPPLIAGTGLHLGVAIAALVAVVAWIMAARSVIAFEGDAAGENPDAARWAGIPVERRRTQALLVSGALGGFAGACQIAGVTHFMGAGLVGYGFVGIAVAMLGRLHPAGIAAAALAMAMLDTGGRSLERRLDIPHDLGDGVKGLLLLAALIVGAWWLRRRLRPRAEAVGPVAAP